MDTARFWRRQHLRGMTLLTVFVLLLASVEAFIAQTTTTLPTHSVGLRVTTTRVYSSVNEDLVNITMHQHRPSMGCTVEESLAGGGLVFVSSVQGNAEAAGLQVGDVVVGVSGLFGEVETVRGLGLEKVRALISGRSESEPLELRVARGTSVMVDHEEALSELCADPDKSDEEAEQCLTDFLSAGYYSEDSMPIEEEPEEQEDGFDILAASVQSIWAQDLISDQPTPIAKKDADAASISQKPKPWSSRSSPSGTFVRDPRTGELRNIDA